MAESKRTTTDTGWDEVRAVLEAAFEHTDAERDAFLDRRCAGRPELRRQVERLLAADASSSDADDVFVGRVEAVAADLMRVRSADQVDSGAFDDSSGGSEVRGAGAQVAGRVVGAYRLLRELGRGGMGTVYAAERADGLYKQRVALKLMHGGLDSGDLLGRFHNERQILAGLDHPGVARLLDGGLADDDRPYFVMEYVDGEPVDLYADRHRLTVDERIELFIEICEIVDYVHRNLLVHCDLKPSNILMTASGEPKVLDFGIAKVLNPDLSAARWGLTQTHRPMTPAYASPEQLQGKALTPAADVYALGLVLHRLLTGYLPTAPTSERRPTTGSHHPKPSSTLRRRGQKTGSSQISGGSASGSGGVGDPRGGNDLVPVEEIAEARRLTPGSLRRRLRGDLDAIVAMALRPEPLTRYRSVGDLAADLRRFLEGQAVSARVGSLRYRATKAVARHRWSLLVAAAVLVALVAGVLAVVEQRDLARRERDRSALISDFLSQVLSAASPTDGQRATTAEELLDSGRDRLLGEMAEDLEGEPEVQARLAEILAGVYEQLDRFDPASELLELALTRRREVAAGGTQDHELTRLLLRLGALRIEQGNHAEGRELLEESLALAEAQDPPDLDAMADGWSQLSYIDGLEGRYEEAERLRREALRVRVELYGDTHPVVASSLNDLGPVLFDLGRCDEAEQLMREALAQRIRFDGPGHASVLISSSNLAKIRFLQGATEEALALQAAITAEAEEIYGAEHLRTARFRRFLGRMLRESGQPERADAEYAKSLDVVRRLLGDEHGYVAGTLVERAKGKLMVDSLESAESMATEALTIGSRSLGPRHAVTHAAGSVLAAVRLRQGELEAAEALLEPALEELEHLPVTSGARRDALTYLVELRSLQGRPVEAERARALLSSASCDG